MPTANSRAEAELASQGSAEMMRQHFPDCRYADVPGLWTVATLAEVESQCWSLNPGGHVGVAWRQNGDGDFREEFRELNAELEQLNAETRTQAVHRENATRSL